MKVAVVYDKERAKGNERFVILLGRGLKKRGIETKAFIYPDERIFECDAVVVRAVLSRLYEELSERGIPALNNRKTQRIAGNKALTYDFLSSLSVPFIPYGKINEKPGAFPVIVKSVDGHGGTEVFLANDENDYESLISGIERTCCEKGNEASERFIFQALADKPDDKRVYVIGGKPIVAMKRVNRYDFRSNYKLGGIASEAEVTEEELSYIGKICDSLGCDYVGIDFMTYGGKSVVNEIEDIVGCRMVYENTSVDILDAYAEYISAELSAK